MSEAGDDDGGARPGGRGPVAEMLLPLPALAAGTVVGALAWWLLVPEAAVTERRGALVSPGRPELFATQDAVFAVVGVALGVLTGTALLLRPGRERVVRLVVVVTGSVLGSLAMWQLGGLLAATGPDDVAPLTVRATGVLALWPAVAATVVFAGRLWSDLVVDRTAPDPPR